MNLRMKEERIPIRQFVDAEEDACISCSDDGRDINFHYDASIVNSSSCVAFVISSLAFETFERVLLKESCILGSYSMGQDVTSFEVPSGYVTCVMWQSPSCMDAECAIASTIAASAQRRCRMGDMVVVYNVRIYVYVCLFEHNSVIILHLN